MAGTGADGTQVFLLPLVSNLVHFAIVVTCRLIWERKLENRLISTFFSPSNFLPENITTGMNKQVPFNV